MVLGLILLIVIAGVIALARAAGSERRIGRRKATERELLDAVERERDL